MSKKGGKVFFASTLHDANRVKSGKVFLRALANKSRVGKRWTGVSANALADVID